MNNIYNYKRHLYLQKLINRVDIQKDVMTKKNNVSSDDGKQLFQKCANELFGNLENNYTYSFDYINSVIKTKNIAKPYIFNMHDNKTIELFPKYITHAIYDTGTEPFYLNKNINVINTPATYIDTASKINNNSFCCFEDILDEKTFNELGIKDILQLKNTVNGNFLNVSIDFIFRKNFISRFDITNNSINNRPKYFKGNSIKNEWFEDNAIYRTNQNIINEGKIYLLSKLLGDLLQAYYCKLYLDKLDKRKRNTCAVFTLDNILRLRSIMFNIPVFYNRTDDCIIMSEYHDTNININKHFEKLYLETMKNNNQSIIDYITNVINIGYFYLDRRRFLLNENIKKILNTLILYISNKTKLAEKIMPNNNLETYRKIIYSYIARHIFHKINEDTYQCYNDIFILFPGLDKETDIIFKTKKNLINIFIGNNKGGGSDNNNNHIGFQDNFLEKYNIDNEDEYTKTIDELMLKNTSDALKLAIYRVISIDNNIEIQNKINLTYNLYNLLYNFFIYNSKTILNSDFLKIIYELYKNKEIQLMSVKEFDIIMEEWVNKKEKERNEDERKRIEEWENFESVASDFLEKKRKRNTNHYTMKVIKSSNISKFLTKRNKTKKISKSR
jgi:hypothetical protein